MVRHVKEGSLAPGQRGQTWLAVNRDAAPAGMGRGSVSVRVVANRNFAFIRTQGGRHADHQ